MRAIPVLFCGLALLCPAVAARPARADIFEHKDADGVVHYTNVQPRGSGWKRTYKETKGSGAAIAANAASGQGMPRRPNPERVRVFEQHIREAAKLYQLPEAFLRAIVMVESNFFADAVSEDGAIGLMQLMPTTAVSMGVLDAFDPRQNVLGGARYLRLLANRFNGDLVLTVAAYNAGEGAVQRYNGVPPYQETRMYVKRVLHHYYAFRNSTPTTEVAMAQ